MSPAVAGGAPASELIEHRRARLIKWWCPRAIEFPAELPLTRIGKDDFRALESEAMATAPR